jgi:hypothetical protein
MKTMYTHVRKLGGPTWKNWERNKQYERTYDIPNGNGRSRKDKNEIKAQKRLEKAQAAGAVITYPNQKEAITLFRASLYPMYKNGVCLTVAPGVTIQYVKHGATRRARLISYHHI